MVPRPTRPASGTPPQEQRWDEHRYLIGVTGRGESPWLANERQRQIRAGNSVMIFDPTNSGDIVNSLGITLPPEAGPTGTPTVPR